MRKYAHAEVQVERKEVRELLEGKMDKEEGGTHQAALEQTAEELDHLKEQLASQAETQRNLSLDSERGVHELNQQITSLSREIEDRASQTNKVLDLREREDERVRSEVNRELSNIKTQKANHEELVKLVSKLQHRPKPGVPLGVEQLLAVPYPMPPGNTRTSNKSGRPRPGSSAPRLHAEGAELREVPTSLPGKRGEETLTSEQILVRPLPSDASGGNLAAGTGQAAARGLMPPSSHTPSLSARASPTVNLILAQNQRAFPGGGAKRPESARTGPGQGAVNMFAGRTERLEKSLDERKAGGARPDMA